MTYKIYADTAFGWALFINTLMFFMADKILGGRFKLHKALPYIAVLSLISTVEYVVLYDRSLFVQKSIYVITYILLLDIYLRQNKKTYRRVTAYSTYIICSMVIAGLLALINSGISEGKEQFIIIIFSFILLFPSCYTLYVYAQSRLKLKSHTYSVTLQFGNHIIHTFAYMDTGNFLTAPGGVPVIVTDCNYAIYIMDEIYIPYIASYNYSGLFNYSNANTAGSIYFQPINYSTISTGSSYMPGFTIEKIVFENGREFTNIIIAISRSRLKLGQKTHILLNESLKPD